MTPLLLPARVPVLLRASLLCLVPLAGCGVHGITPVGAPTTTPATPSSRPTPSLPTLAPARAGAAETVHLTLSAISESPVAGVDDGEAGAAIYFSLLGDLYRVDASGGEATVLTTGPAYDTDPAVSPDRRLLAFRSDRDGLPGLYLLALSHGLPDGDPRPLAIEDGYVHVRPLFSADGQDLVYARHRRTPAAPETWELTRKPIAGGAAQVLARASGEITGIAFTTTGKLFYSVALRGAQVKTQFFRFPEKEPRLVVPGFLGALSRHPAGGLLARLSQRPGGRQTMVLLSPEGEQPKVLRELSPTRSLPGIGWLDRRGVFVVNDDGALRLLRPDGSLAGETRFRAQATLAIAARSTEAMSLGGTPGQPLYPDPLGERPGAEAALDLRERPHDRLLLGQDGELIYVAGGRLWRREGGSKIDASGPGGPTGRPFTALTPSGELAFDPALSPDRRTLVYCRGARAGAELVRASMPPAEFAPQVLLTSPFLAAPAVTTDGKAVLVTVTDASGATQLHRVALTGGPAVPLPIHGGRDLQASAVPGGICYFGAGDRPGVLYRIAEGRIAEGASAGKPLTSLSSPLRFGACSPDGQAIAYVRDGVAWLAPLRPDRPVVDGDGRRLTAVSAAAAAALVFTGDDKLTVPVQSGTLVVGVAAALAGKAAAETPVLRQEDIEVAVPRPKVLAGRVSKLVVRNVTLIEPGAERSQPATTLLIEDGRVSWVGPDANAPATDKSTRIIDGSRRFALPGLIEMQGRLHPFDPRAYLAYGVTTIRDVRAGHHALDYQAAGEAAYYPMPRVAPAPEVPLLKTEAEVETFVQGLAAAGYRMARVDPALPRHLRRAAVAAATPLGIRVAARARSVEDLVTAAIDGVSLIELQFAIEAGPAADVLALLARTEVAVVTLLHPLGLSTHQFRRGYPSQNPVLFELAVPTLALAAHKASQPGPPPDIEALSPETDAQVMPAMSLCKRLLGAGVHMVAGTDAGSPGAFPGVSLPWELVALSRSGLSSWQVLRMATVDAANALRTAEVGQVIAGARGDVVLYAGDPVADMRNLERPVLIIRGGQVYTPEKLMLGK